MTPLLQSWNDTPTKHTILSFIKSVTDEKSMTYVLPAERIAVFDNDGTLWCEKPMYIQFDYFNRKLAEQAENDPSLQSRQPWSAAWNKDFDWLDGAITKHYMGDDRDFRILLGGILTLADNTPVEQVETAAREFIEREQNPALGIPYKNCVYQPMLELLSLLETNGFTNYIVSGGGRDFMRGFVHDLYGIPRERVIGSTLAYRFVDSDQGGEILQKPELDVVDDGPGKPIQIWNVIGRRPIMAVGNSNGDLPMMKFTGNSVLPALRLLVVHDDAEREFEYSAGAEKAISAVKTNEWTAVSIQRDWQIVFPG